MQNHNEEPEFVAVDLAQEIGLKTAHAPHTPESYGASPQGTAGRSPEWDKPMMTPREAAERCINLCRNPSNLRGVTWGCRLGERNSPTEIIGNPSRCLVLEDGEFCEALDRINPALYGPRKPGSTGLHRG